MAYFQSVKNARAEGGRLNREEPFVVKTQEVEIFKCPVCGHMQIPYLLDSDYYKNYDEVSGFQQYGFGLNKIEEKLIKLRKFSNQNGKILEIGSGAGYSLEIASKYFESAIGVDPSEKECEIARNKGLSVICDIFDKSLILNEKIIAMSTFQTLEHVENLKEIVQHAYDVLEEEGVAIINVPNGEQIMRNELYHQILLEHINYFTPQSLITLVENVGFEVIDIVLDRETIEIDLYVRKMKKVVLEETYLNQKSAINILLKKYEKIGIYGAGAKSAFYSSLINDENKEKIVHVFDSNASKENTYLSGVNKKIEETKVETLQDCDVIVVFASSYNENIILKLKDMKYKNNIITFEQGNVKLLCSESY